MTNSVKNVIAPSPARRLAWAALLALCASCGRCGAPAATDAAELLPSRWTSVALTGPLGGLAQRVNGALALAAQIPGGDVLGENAHALSNQLGLDLFSREGLVSAGLDPERGAAVALLEAPAGSRAPWIAALPLSNDAGFAQRLESTLTGRAGYPLRTDVPRGNVHCVVFARAGVDEKIAYAVVRGYGVVARGTDPTALIAEAAARTTDKSLASDPRLAHARAELERPDLILLSASGNPLLARLGARGGTASPPGDSTLGVSLLPDGLLVRLTQDLPDARRAELRSLFAAAAPDAFQTPLAPLELRINGAPAQLPAVLAQAPLLREVLANLRAAFQKNGADLDRDLFAALSPGAALALDLAPEANLGRALDPSALDLRARSPFDIVRLYATASARDPEAMRRGFAALAQALPALGATAVRTAEKKSISGGLLDEWSTHYSGGEGMRFGIFVPGRDLCGQSAPARTQALVYALGGTGSLEQVLAAKLPCAKPLANEALHPASNEPARVAPDTSRASADGAAVQLQLDLGALADAINKLPDSAYGSGPQVFVARSLVSQLIVPMQRLRASAELRPSERGVQASLRVRLAPQTGTPAPAPGQAPSQAP